MPKVSVVIAARNAAKYIERAVRSCLSQTFSDYEIIVVNDSSIDNTSSIVKLFGDRVRFISVEREGMGCGLPSNIGIRNAKSPFVVRVDADDYISENMLQIEYLFLLLNKDMDAVACDYFIIDDNENILSRENYEIAPIACGVMFRKDKLLDIGLYNESLPIWEEKELRHRFLQKYQIHRIPLPLYRYTKHEGSLTYGKTCNNS